MTRLKISIALRSLNLPLRKALVRAQAMAITGVEIDAAGDLAPDNLSQTGRREFRHLLRGHNLEVSAIYCPLRHGLDWPENQEARIEHVRKAMSLSFDLGPRVVVAQVGKTPEKPEGEAFARMSEGLLALGHHGDRTGTRLALETGLEAGQDLAAFLSRFDTGGLAVAYDPANLVMHGHNAYDSARGLGHLIALVHAKDARVSGASRTAQEVPLGHGDLDWMTLLGVLEEIDYHGWLTIERETGTDRARDVAEGVAFLRRLVG